MFILHEYILFNNPASGHSAVCIYSVAEKLAHVICVFRQTLENNRFLEADCPIKERTYSVWMRVRFVPVLIEILPGRARECCFPTSLTTADIKMFHMDSGAGLCDSQPAAATL